jgi:hypothetical protein
MEQSRKSPSTTVATQPYPLIDVSGTPYERGYQHGRAAGDLIRRYPDALRRVIIVEARYRAPDTEPAELADAELEARTLHFLPFFERFCPEHVTEIRGIADGAEVPFWMALLPNVRAEVGVFDRLSHGVTGCTAFAVGPDATADGGVLIGQNQDQNALMRELTIILRVEPDDGPNMLMATFGGLIAYGGINSAGVGIMQNSLANSVWRLGLPHYPLKRALLQQDSISGCLAQFDRAPLGSCATTSSAIERKWSTWRRRPTAMPCCGEQSTGSRTPTTSATAILPPTRSCSRLCPTRRAVTSASTPSWRRRAVR